MQTSEVKKPFVNDLLIEKPPVLWYYEGCKSGGDTA